MGYFQKRINTVYFPIPPRVYTIQRLKRAQDLPTQVDVPRVGYLTLPEYTGAADQSAPSVAPMR